MFTTAEGAADVVTERVIGRLVVGPSAPTAGTIITIDMGLVLISSAAFAAGVAAVPDPNSEPDAKWLWVDNFFVDQHSTSDQMLSKDFVFDVKVRRVFEGEMTLALVFDNQTGAAGKVGGYIRLLSRIRGT